VVLGGAGAVTYAVANPDADPVAEAARSKRPMEVHELAMKSDGTGRRKVERTGTELFSLLGVTWAGSKTLLDGTAQVRTRSSETGKWTGWQSLDLEPHPVDKAEPDAKEARGASDPLWVGPSDGVEARVVAADGSASSGLPKGLEVTLVDPGVTAAEAKNKALDTDEGASMENAAFVAEDPADPTTPTDPASGSASPTQSTAAELASSASASPTGSASASASASASPPEPEPEPAPVPSPPPSTVTQPPIVSRAQWGADESTVQDPAEYIEKVSAVFVHHTVGTNDYSCAESPALVRGLMAYHVQGNKWNDLGYNFVVDKCGRIFEGRGGGIDLPVRGAHTYGFNGDSAGIAVLGDFEGDAKATPPKVAGTPTRAALESVARVAAWKLGQYGGNPSGQVTLTAGAGTGVWKAGEQATLNTISGHRDGFATACPGKNLYSKLSEVRRYASSPGKNSAIPTADFNRDGINDLVAGTPKASSSRGRVTIVPGGLDGPVSAAKLRLTQGSPGVPGASETGDLWGTATAWGDINGDGHADLVVGAPGEDDTIGHKDRGYVTILYGPTFATGADTMALDGDFYAPGAKFGAAVAVGDFNADGKADVFAASTGTGGTWEARYAKGVANASVLTGSNSSLSHADAASGDFNRDGYADVALNYRDASGIGRVTWFKGSKSGLDRVSTLSVKGGRSIAAGDVNGNGFDDIVIGQPYTAESGAKAGGQVTMVPGTSTGFTTTGMRTIHQDTAGVPGAAEAGDAMGASVSVGDYDADGYADALAGLPNEDLTRSGTKRSNAGTSLLLKGTSSGLTGSGARSFHQDTSGIPGATESNDKLGSAVSLTDFSGYGRADLMIGVAGENSGNGTLLYLPSGGSGISTSGSVYYGVSQLGTPRGARLGQALTP
jgi:hypothetical protein